MYCSNPSCSCDVTAAGETCSPACAAATVTGCTCGHELCSRTVDGDALDPHTVGESMTAPGATVEYDGRP